ncbi:hypothetical protein QN359_11815 [Undibacterium sp. 5I2]|nr:hypothetical protein [Undibacterium sp. 5I2]
MILCYDYAPAFFCKKSLKFDLYATVRSASSAQLAGSTTKWIVAKAWQTLFTPKTPHTASFPHAFGGNPVSFLTLKTSSFLAFSVKHERRWVPAKSAQE